ncbi:MAG: hypothetical protein K0R90_549 [Oscillospiraceae bacterium]|jgi:hypothetical protein|nr:hypothetical protein [Oscillospiraceae bacterium]
MIGIFIIGIIFLIIGFYCIINGKLPIIKTYHGVKNIMLYSRINGIAISLCGILMILNYAFNFESYMLVMGLMIIVILTLIAEIISKSI